MISTDTSWLHIATLYEIKTIGLYGFDNLETWKPPNTIAIKSNPFIHIKICMKQRSKTYNLLCNLDCAEIVSICKKLLN